LGCYHKQDPSRLAFYDMATSTSIGIYALEKEKGVYPSTCSINSLSHGLIHLVWEK
jgi:hypothetical protein